MSLFSAEGIAINFGGIKAVDHATVDLYPGEVVGLLGHNGAGKSTLIKVLSGAYKRDAGQIFINGQEVNIDNPRDAKALGIETIYQTLALADNVDAAANLYLGRELRTGWGTLDDVAMEAECRKVMGRLNPNFRRFKEPVKALSGGQRRRVGIARAMASKPHLLLFDDPITGLDPLIATSIDDEIVKLRDLEDVTTLLVTHQIRDAFYIAEHKAEQRGNAIEVIKTDPTDVPNVEFLVLLDGSITFQGTASELLASNDPYLTEYLYKTLPPW